MRPEQCSKDCATDTKTNSCEASTRETALVAHRTAHQIQDSHAHFQGSEHVDAGISQPPHLDSQCARDTWSLATPALFEPFTTTNYAKRAFHCSAPTVWNSLPRTVLDCVTLSTLKSKLKMFSHIYIQLIYYDLWPALLKLRPKATCMNVIIILLIFFDPGTQFQGNEKKYPMQYKKVQKSSWNEVMNLAPPPASQNYQAVRWHCTAESERGVAEIKS